MNSEESRAERQRRVNRYRMVQAELMRQEKEAAFDQMRARKEKAAEVDIALAETLAEQQRAELKDAKMLQLVSDFPELRELKKALEHELANKGRSEFTSQKPALLAKEAREHKEFVEKCMERDRVLQQQEEEERQKKLAEFRKHQQDQLNLIREKRERALAGLEEQKKERIAVDAVIARLNEQDMLDSLARREAVRKQEEEQAEFYRLRAELKRAEKIREQKEDAAITAYLDEQNRRREIEKKLGREKDIVKERILQEQCRKIMEEKQRKLDLENVLQEYYEEERIAKERALMAAEKESHERLCAAVTKENLALIEARRKEQEKKVLDEIKYRQLAMEELAAAAKAEKERKEQLLREREAKIQEDARFLAEREKLKEHEKELERQNEELAKKRELELQDYIRRARMKLLDNYLPKLGTFVPSHVFTAEEREHYLPQLQVAQEHQQRKMDRLRSNGHKSL